MSLFADYYKEREGCETLEMPNGFATYRIDGRECYIKDIYVSPQDRKHGLASELANHITVLARRAGCTHLLGSVCVDAYNSDVSERVLEAYGFKYFKTLGTMKYYVKELK